MPKVSTEYIEKKRTQILDAAFEVFQKKPLYEITMIDIVKECGISKGGIYLYFSDVDEVIIHLINRETAKSDYRNEIDKIIEKQDTIEDTIRNLFNFLGNYINGGSVILGKIQFELTVYMATNPQKAEKLRSSLTEQENGQYVIGLIYEKISEGVRVGEFKATYPLKDIFDYISTSIDGVVSRGVLQKCYGDNDSPIDIINIFNIIANSVLCMLKH